MTTLQDISWGNENKNFMHKKNKDNLTVLEARVNLLIFACQADICFLKMCKKQKLMPANKMKNTEQMTEKMIIKLRANENKKLNIFGVVLQILRI